MVLSRLNGKLIMNITPRNQNVREDAMGYSQILDDFEQISSKKFYRIICVGMGSDGANQYKIVHAVKAFFYTLASLFSKNYQGVKTSLLELVDEINKREAGLDVRSLKDEVSKIWHYMMKSGCGADKETLDQFGFAAESAGVEGIRKVLNAGIEKQILADVPLGFKAGIVDARNIHNIRDTGSLRSSDSTLNKVEILSVWVRDIGRTLKPVFDKTSSDTYLQVNEFRDRVKFERHLQEMGMNESEIQGILHQVNNDGSNYIFTEMNNVLDRLIQFYSGDYNLLLGTLSFFTQALFGTDTELARANSDWMMKSHEAISDVNLQFYTEKRETQRLHVTVSGDFLSIAGHRIQEFTGLSSSIHSEVGLRFNKKGEISREYASFYR